MKKSQKAVEYFNNGYNCAQSVLAAFSDSSMHIKNELIKISSGMGAGIGYSGNVCGAVSGAIMSIGLMYGMKEPTEKEAKTKTYDLSKKFMKEFRQVQGSTLCKELIQYDLSKPEELQMARDNNVFNDLCPGFIEKSVEILEKIIMEEEKRV